LPILAKKKLWLTRSNPVDDKVAGAFCALDSCGARGVV
jgi:hypothetical protein